MAKKKPAKGINLVIDPVEFADHCEQRDADVRQHFIKMAKDPMMLAMMSGHDHIPDPQGELNGLAMFGLIDLEKDIIRMEHYLAHGKPNEVSNQERVEKYKKEYAALYKQLKDEFGRSFDRLYEETKREENECARQNLNSSGGRLYSYVLPKFNPDGTHEPWGEKDVPWNTIKKGKKKK